MDNYAFCSIIELAAHLELKNISAEALTRIFLSRIDKHNQLLNAYINVFPEQALEQARESDARRKAGASLGWLDGIPMGIKDLCEIEGSITTGGSKEWINRISTETAEVIEKLRAHGVVILGKTHTVEWAFGGWGTNALLGTPRNPWDRWQHRIPGGSSSGSAVAVAAGLAAAAIGTDMGGSVRIPAALNSVTGLKTTVGRIATQGVLPLSHSLDSVGVFTRCADDAAIVFDAMMNAPAQSRLQENYRIHGLEGADLGGKVICVLPDEQYETQVQRSVRLGVRDMVRMAEMAGAKLVRKALPFSMETAMNNCGRLIAAEGWRVHKEHIADPEKQIDPNVRRRVLAGQNIDDRNYAELLAQHAAMKTIWQEWMDGGDALLIPATPFTALPLNQVDENNTSIGFFTRFVNWTGACALSIQAGFDPQNLPVGAQLVGKANDEYTLLQIASVIQRMTAWHAYHPMVG